MAVFLAWTSAPLPEALTGPWTEYRRLADDLALVESTHGLSRVYHEIKWSLPERTALIVTPVSERPKLSRLPEGTTTWLRERVPRTS